MKYLKIQNDGVLDIRLVALMGGTTKAGDKYKIGQFGTGLKYTLAYLFRTNIDFKIFSGTEEVKIGIEVERIRDEDFEIICINNHRTSITTKMGESWEAWMIVREMWCNALDEGGAMKEITSNPVGQEDKTTFYIQVDSNIQGVLDKWDMYFIHGKEPLFKNYNYAIYPGGETLRIYKNGVLIEEFKQPGLFSYDILDATINELREFKGSKEAAITRALSQSNEVVAEYFLDNIDMKFFEGGMDYNWYCTWNDNWQKVLGNAKLIHAEALQNLQATGINPDTTKLIVVPKQIYEALTKQFKGIGALRVAAKASEFYESFDEQMENKIKQALVILEACNYVMHPELTFVYGHFEDKRILASIHMDEKKIFISNTLSQKSLFAIVACVIEENEHFNTGLSDHTRAFQQHFIDLYARSLLKLYSIEV